MEKQSTRKFLKLIVALVALFLLGASALMLASCKEEEHQHSYTSSVTTPATCSNPGVETFTCSCGLTYTTVIPATGEHTWETVQEYPASCESDGYSIEECSQCHTQRTIVDEGSMLTHKYEAVETVEATCTEDGYQLMQCSYCGDRYYNAQYSAEHKASGHKFNANTDADDPASDEDKKLGFVTVSPADCLNAAQLERKCSVCGFSEPKESGKPLGHLLNDKTVEKVPCKVDLSLIDKDGNTGFAFECERENCPVTVTIDNAGNTRHYITASAHKMKVVEEKTFCVAEDSDEVLPTGTNASGKGYRYEICENCDTYGTTADATKNKVTELEPTGHKWNTVQVDGKTPVVVCEQDTGLTRTKYQDLMKAALGTTKYATVAGALQSYFKDGTKYSRYCSDCGALTVAGGHEYVVSPLEEGKYDWTDYQKDENGLPVEAPETVTVANMDCRYVQVCKNEGCGKVLDRGQHGTVSEPTCRKGGYCEVCGEKFKEQLAHEYIDVATIIDYEDSKDADEKALYNAYVKVSATETWMTPVEGGCDEKSTTVHVCKNCLLTAADDKSEEEVVWNQATAKPADGKIPASDISNTNAYVITEDFGHDYVPVYFRLSDGQEIPFTQTTCAVGFNVKYVCDKCGEVVINVPVADDPATTAENTDPATDAFGNLLYNEARNNKPVTVEYTDPYGNEKTAFVYTDADGFVIDLTKVSANVGYTPAQLAAALAAKVTNQDRHSVQVASEYAKRNGYVASTCISTAEIPVVCEYCGAALSYTYTDLAAAKDKDTTDDLKDYKLDFFINNDKVMVEGKEEEYAISMDIKTGSADTKLNYLNHAEGAKIFDCGTHCDASEMVNGVKTYICSGYVSGHETKANITAASPNFANMFNEEFHSTVTVSYKLATASNYYSDYTIRLATIAAGTSDVDDIDWTQVTFATDTKLSVCAANNFASLGSNTTYTMPKAASELANGGTFFVLTDAEGNNYLVNTFRLYTEDKGDNTMTAVQDNQKVAQDDDFFLNVMTCDAPVHASDAASLGLALEKATADEKGVLTVKFAANKTVTIAPDGTADDDLNKIWDQLNSKKADNIVFDLNGSTFKWNYNNPITFGNNFANGPTTTTDATRTFTIKNGNITVTGTTVPNRAAFELGKDTTLKGLAFVVENCQINTGAYDKAIEVAYDEDAQSTITIKNSTITSYGKVGVSVEAPKEITVPATLATVIDMTNTNIVMTKALPTDKAVLATAMVVGAPVNVKVSGGEFSANGQVLVVRGGDVSVSTTKLTLNAYTDTRVVVADTESTIEKNEVKFSELFTNKTAVTAPWNAFIAGVTDVQTYRMAGLWGTGADVARAAVVLGNNDTSNYQFAASLRLDRANIVVGDGEETVVVGTTYASTSYKDDNNGTTDVTTDDKPIAIVTLNATGSALTADRVVYTYNAYNTDGTLKNGEHIVMSGLIPVAD